MTALFFIRNLGLGVGLAMDACAVSMSNGLSEPKMRGIKAFCIAFTFAFFQAAMPIIGYFAGHAFVRYIGKFIPWIALVLLTFIGVKMIVDGIKEGRKEEKSAKVLTAGTLIMQAVATSIDALSVGVAIATYKISEALLAAVLIAAVTFVICLAAVYIGKKFGDKLGSKAVVLGGCILIAIGIEICITGLL